MLAGAFDYDLEPKTRVRLFEGASLDTPDPQQVVHTGETTLRATPSYPMALSPWRFRWWAPAPPAASRRPSPSHPAPTPSSHSWPDGIWKINRAWICTLACPHCR